MKSILISFLILTAMSCKRAASGEAGAKHEVVLYSSVDEPFVTPLIKRFEQQTSIHVRFVADTEATKSAALVERIEAEKDHPRADVYWGNEIFHTINLAERGIFSPYRPAPASDLPPRWRDSKDLFTDIGLRARMIAVSTRPEFKDAVAAIHGLSDLTNPALKGRVGICHPGFGTASGHLAAMQVLWGQTKFSEYMQALRANDVKLLGGNSAVVDQVAAGNLIAGLSDNDDLHNAQANGQPVAGILPDQDEQGTLLIPTTIALIKNGPNGDDAKKLIDFLCDPAIEKELIAAHFLAYSVRDPALPRAMNVDYAECARHLRQAVENALTILQDRRQSQNTNHAIRESENARHESNESHESSRIKTTSYSCSFVTFVAPVLSPSAVDTRR